MSSDTTTKRRRGVKLGGRTETDPPTHEEDPVLCVTEVGRQLGKSHGTISQWCRDGLLVAVRMPGGRWGVRKSEVNRFLGGSALGGQVG